MKVGEHQEGKVLLLQCSERLESYLRTITHFLTVELCQCLQLRFYVCHAKTGVSV